jgi:Fur family transcriptional regulator, ferric uptake regulator
MNSAELLKKHGLRLTKPRQSVLERFQEKSGTAISIKELMQLFSHEIDKVTLYRTLHTFEETQLIHRIFDDSGLEKYALCVGTCETHEHHAHHNHAHVHFKCESCEQTECIADAELPVINLPQGYTSKSANFVVIGICGKCS